MASNFLFRLANILNPKKSEDSSGASRPSYFPPKEVEQEPDYNQFFNEETPSLQAYREHLSSMPSREDFKQGTGSKIATILAGALEGASKSSPAAGINMIQNLRDRPFAQAMGEWEAKGKGLGERAGLEVRLGESKRKFAQDTEQNRLAQAEHIRKLQADLAGAKSQAERDRISAEIAEARKRLMAVQGKGIEAGIERGKERERTRQGFLGVAKERNIIAKDKAKGSKEKVPSQTESLRAEQKAVSENVSRHPSYKKFVSERGLLQPPPLDDEEYYLYKVFKALVEREKEKRLKGLKDNNYDLTVDIPALKDIEDEDEEEIIGSSPIG